MIYSFEMPHEIGTVCHGSKCLVCGEGGALTTGLGPNDILPQDQPFYIVREATREEFAAQFASPIAIAPDDYFYEVLTD